MSEEHKLEISRIKLPITFEVELLLSKSYSISITILLEINSIQLEKLPNDFRDRQLVFKLQRSMHETLLALSTNYFYVKIHERVTDKDWKIGIIYCIRKNYYGIIPIPKEIRPKDIVSNKSIKISNYENINGYLSNWKLIPSLNMNEENDFLVQNFSMKPPSVIKTLDQSTDVSKQLPQLLDDPLQFLYSRYYSILYSLTTPLNYFPKTTISRFKILCENDKAKIKSNLLQIHLSIEELDSRHDGRFGVLKTIHDGECQDSPVNIKEKYEIKNQREFLSKHHDLILKVKNPEENQNDTSKKKNGNERHDNKLYENDLAFVLEIKIREAQLQILVLLEVLDCWKISESEFIDINLKRQEDNETKKKKRKKSLVRKKSTSKKIVPTFLGMGVNLQSPDRASQSLPKELDEFVLFENLNTLIDRMGLWDTLLDRAPGDKDNSSFGFLAYVIIPYFKQKLPLTVKYLIDRVKGLSLKLNTKPSKNSTDILLEQSKSLSASEKNNTQMGRSSRFAKTFIDPKQVPLLKKTTSSTSSSAKKQDLLPAFALKRSKSNLSSKNLQKRQIDMSSNLKSFTEIPNGNNNDKDLKNKSTSEKHNTGSKNSIIFGNAKRIKSQPSNLIVGNLENSISQVEATPSKKKPDISIQGKSSHLTTPSQSNRHNRRTTISRTPVNQYIRPTLGASYKDTTIPCSVSKSQSSLGDKLLYASMAPPMDAVVNSSPASTSKFDNIASEKNNPTVSEIASSPPNTLLTPSTNIMSSPSVISSSTRSKRKPGDPVLLQDSPFFDQDMNGSPTSSGILNANFSNSQYHESGSIFKRTSLKKRKTSQINKQISTTSEDYLEKGLGIEEETDADLDLDSDYERLTKTTKPLKKYKK